MRTPEESRARTRPERIFRLLMRLLPTEFREDFGDEMKEAFRADHDDAQRGGQRGGRLRFWWRTATGILRTAPREHLDTLRGDVGYGLRVMRRKPLFTLTAVLSLAIGIGATTTVVAVFNAIFVRSIPGVERSEHLVNIKPKKIHEETFLLTSFPNFVDLRDGNEVLSDLAGFHGFPLSLAVEANAEPELMPAQLTTWNYFSVFGLRPQLGRFFDSREDDEKGAHPIVVISSWLWENRFGRDPAVVGQAVWLNGRRFTVIGVATEGFRGHFVGFSVDIFMPSSMAEVAQLDRDDPAARWVELIGKKNPDLDLSAVRAGLALDAARLEELYPDENRGLEIHVERATGIDADIRTGLLVFLVVLLAVSGFVLLIACLNIANMLFTHVIWRQRELATRLALGARRRRVARQLLTESVVLALLAGGIGSLLALWGTWLARSVFPSFGGRVALDIHFDNISLAVALAISLGTVLISGVAPAMRACRVDLASVLRQSSGQVGTRSKFWGGLVVAQVALSVVVLVCAGLFIRVLDHATRINPGFDPANVLQAGLNPALLGMEPDQAQQLFQQIARRVEALPGAQEVTLARRVPLSLGARFFPATVSIRVPGMEPPPDQDGFLVEHNIVSENYFETLRIPILEGRGIGPAAGPESRRIAVVNESFAQRFFPGQSPVGRLLYEGDDEIEIVGMSANSKYRTLDEEKRTHIYFSFAHEAPERAVLLMRHVSGTVGLAEALRGAIREEAPHLPLLGLGHLEDQLSAALLPQRIAGGVAGALGFVGLLLTAIGLYGVVSYSVSRRANEIGVRMSLGATPAQIQGMMMRQGLLLALMGVGIGVPVVAVAAQLFGAFLVGVSPIDAPTYLAISAVLLLTSLAASYFPARRASRVDGLRTLLSE